MSSDKDFPGDPSKEAEISRPATEDLRQMRQRNFIKTTGSRVGFEITSASAFRITRDQYWKRLLLPLELPESSNLVAGSDARDGNSRKTDNDFVYPTISIASGRTLVAITFSLRHEEDKFVLATREVNLVDRDGQVYDFIGVRFDTTRPDAWFWTRLVEYDEEALPSKTCSWLFNVPISSLDRLDLRVRDKAFRLEIIE